MKIKQASYQIITDINSDIMLRNIENAGRVCYASESKKTDTSAIPFITNLIKSGHESVLEHEFISIKFFYDRGVVLEQVRHRLCSYSNSSTRYINYTKENKGGECTFIDISQHLKNPGISLNIWVNHMCQCEYAYKAMIDAGESPQIARSVLPNSFASELVVTANLREWRTIFKQRTSKAAHPQMREIMCPLLDELKAKIPVIFDDITY